MKKLLWSIPGLAVFFYSATVLTQYGYNSYFGIPQQLIRASIADNIIYFFQLFKLATGIVGWMSWWMWIIAALLILIITLFWYLSNFPEIILTTITIILWSLSLLGFYNFGSLLAKSTTEFYVPSSNCSLIEQGFKYIVPVIYEDSAVFISIDSNTKKIKDGFLVKKLTELNCGLEQKYIGKIVK